MSNEKRVRQDFLGGLVDTADLTGAGTTLNSAGLAAIVTTIDTTNHLAIILDPDGIYGAPEIAYITAFSVGATSATILRGQEGTTARGHLLDTPWVHGPTAKGDFASVKDSSSTNATVTVTSSDTDHVIHSRTITGAAAGTYLMIGSIMITTPNAGRVMLKAGGPSSTVATATVLDERDTRTDSYGERVVFSVYPHAGGDLNAWLSGAGEAASWVCGATTDDRFGAKLMIVGPL